jgi:hypothetical protein
VKEVDVELGVGNKSLSPVVLDLAANRHRAV